MRRLLTRFFAFFVIVFGTFGVTNAGTFSVDAVKSYDVDFQLSAAGVFTVDCGGGTLVGGYGVSGSTIDRTAYTKTSFYRCEYSESISNYADRHTITISGTATGYGGPAIIFAGSDITAVSGNMSSVFPYLGSNDGQYPTFENTFTFCWRLKEISDNLFADYTVGAPCMFKETFSYSGLTEIPENLFGNITTGSDEMFWGTFEGCDGLTSIPSHLFSNITTGGVDMFAYTFGACLGITGYISPDLFYGLYVHNVDGDGMFVDPFYDTGLDTDCSSGTTRQFFTGYEDYWGGKVACIQAGSSVSYDCGRGSGTPPGCQVGNPVELRTSTCIPPSGEEFVGWRIHDEFGGYLLKAKGDV